MPEDFRDKLEFFDPVRISFDGSVSSSILNVELLFVEGINYELAYLVYFLHYVTKYMGNCEFIFTLSEIKLTVPRP